MSRDPASNYGWALVLCMAKALALRMQAAVLPACMRNLNAQFSLARPCTAKFDAHLPVFLTSLFLYFPTSQNSLNGRLATALFQIKVKHPSGGWQICGTAAALRSAGMVSCLIRWSHTYWLQPSFGLGC